MRKHKKFLLALAVGGSLCLITLSAKKVYLPFSLEPYVISVLAPAQYVITQAIRKVHSGWDHYIYLVGVEKENQALREKLLVLTKETHRCQEMEERCRRLLDLLDFKREFEFKTKAAEVVGRDLNSWYGVIIINRGTQDGVTKGKAVVSHLGLVGHIIQAASRWSKVLLITDFRSAVDALIQRSRQGGVVVGSSRGMCRMKYLPMNADILPGDQVVSSGLGGLYPKGLPIGRVVEVKRKDQGFFKEAEINLNVDMNKLEEVLIVLEKE